MSEAALPVDEAIESFTEAVESIGFGWAQLLACILGGSVYFQIGEMMTLASVINQPVAQEFDFKEWQSASLTSIISLGVLLGSAASGPLGDMIGSRDTILMCIVFVTMSSCVCFLVSGYLPLSLARFSLGAALGIGISPWCVLCTEITPKRFRSAAQSLSSFMWVLGELFVAASVMLSDPTMKVLSWPQLSRLCLVPQVLILVSCLFFLVSSPLWLAAKGRNEKAKNALAIIARQNGASDVPAVRLCFVATSRKSSSTTASSTSTSLSSDTSSGDFSSQFKALFGPEIRSTTITLAYTCFVWNWQSFGLIYALPSVFADGSSGTSPGMNLLIGIMWEIPGYAAAAVVGSLFSRLTVLAASTVTVALASLGFGLAISFSPGLAISGCLAVMRIGSSIMCMAMYLYASEVYPVRVRTTGCALSVTFGRLGSIIAPVICSQLSELTGSQACYFYVIAASLALSACLILQLTSSALRMSGRDLLAT
jgi:MFS family permease